MVLAQRGDVGVYVFAVRRALGKRAKEQRRWGSNPGPAAFARWPHDNVWWELVAEKLPRQPQKLRVVGI